MIIKTVRANEFDCGAQLQILPELNEGPGVAFICERDNHPGTADHHAVVIIGRLSTVITWQDAS